jgi:hypothetical protein
MSLRNAAHRISIFLAALLLIVLIVPGTPAQLNEHGGWINGVTEPLWFASEGMSQAEIANVQSRWKMLQEENEAASARNEWAGDYYSGNGLHGGFLRWSHSGKFVLLHVNQCAAMVEGASYGQSEAHPSLIQFLPESNKHAPGAHGHMTKLPLLLKFIPVKWAGVHYLVLENKITAFGDSVAGLGVYNSISSIEEEEAISFVKMGDKSEGFSKTSPIVPPGYERFIKQPIDARITAVGSSYIKSERADEWYSDLITPVTINAGRAHGVKPRMEFYVIGSEAYDRFKVRRLGERSSQGVIIRSVRKRPGVSLNQWDDGAELVYAPITVGLQLSTSWHKYWESRPETSAK